MNTLKVWTGIVMLIVSVSVLGICQGQVSRKVITVPFNSYGSYTWPTLSGYAGTLSVDMTYLGSAVSNTFTLSVVRSNVTHALVTQAGNSMKSLTWYTPAPYLFQSGDQLVWTNAASGSAVLTINVEIR